MLETAQEISLQMLLEANLAQLEQIFTSAKASALPRGVYRGHFLMFLETIHTHKRWVQWILDFGFHRLPFGIDFEDSRWFFFHPACRVGHFTMQIGPSRWREATTVQLHYHTSHLPKVIREHLYDEVLPLTNRLCLGLGGLNQEQGSGDIFYFALERLDDVETKRRI